MAHRMPGLALSALILSLPLSASAQELSLREATEMLASENADEVRMAIEALGANGSARAVAPLAERIKAGLPAELLDAAVETLGLLGRPEAGPTLFRLLNHRRTEVRLAALNAISACKPRGASEALTRALSDTQPEVRATAAQSLGAVGAKESLDDLYHAFDRGILEAAASIGQLVSNVEEIDRLLAYLGRMPLDAMTPALNEMLARDDLPNRAKTHIIGHLEELATPEIKTYLQEMIDLLDEGPVREAAQAAVVRIPG